MKSLKWIVAILSIMVVAVGCGGQVDTNKSIEQVQQEVEKMSLADLEKTAKAYAKAIEDKKAELKGVTDELRSLAPKDLLGAKAKEIKAAASEVTSSIKDLSKRYSLYLNKYKALGGDVSKISLS